MGDEDDSDDLEPDEELGRIWIPGRDDGGSGTNIAALRRLQGQRDADIEVARGTFKTLLKEVDAARIDTGQAKRITKAAAAMDKLKQLQSQFVQSAASVDPAKWEKALTLQYRKARQAIKKLKSSGEGGGGGGGGASGGAESTTEGGGSKGAPRARGSSVEKTTHWAHRDFLKNRPPIVVEAALLVMLEQRKGVAVAFYVQTVLHNVAKDFTGSAESTARLVRTLVEQKAEVGAADDAGRTPLHSAAAHNKGPAESVSALVRALAEAKAEVNARDEDDCTPLHSAAAHNEGPAQSVSALVRALAEVKAEVGARDSKLRTPLHSAAARNEGFAESVSALVRALAEVKAEVNARDSKLRTPLHLVFTGDMESAGSVLALTNALLEAKAEVGARDNQGQTPLHVAILRSPNQTGLMPLIYRLLGAKADVLAPNADGHTPLDISRGWPVETLLMGHLAKQQLAGAVSTSHSAAESSSLAQTLTSSDAVKLLTTAESTQHSGAASLQVPHELSASLSLDTLLALDICQDNEFLHDAVCELRDNVRGLGEVKDAIARAVVRELSGDSDGLGHFALWGESQASRSHVAKMIGAVLLAARQHTTTGTSSHKPSNKRLKRLQHEIVDMRGVDIVGSNVSETRRKVVKFLDAHKSNVIVFDEASLRIGPFARQSLAAVALSTWMAWLERHSEIDPAGQRVASAETVTCIVAGSVKGLEAAPFRDSKFRSLFHFLPGVVTSAHMPAPRKRKLVPDSNARKRVGHALKSEVKPEVKPESAAESGLLP